MRSSVRLLAAVVAAGLIVACDASVGGAASMQVPPGATSSASRSGPVAGAPQILTQPPSGPAAASVPSAMSGDPSTSTNATTPADPTASEIPGSGTPAAGSPSPSPVPVTGKPDGAIGTVGIGDPYYPRSGNGGYEVDAYDITLTYDPATDLMSAAATVSATVTRADRLGRFNLDLQPTMHVSAVSANGSPASYEHRNAELTITPARGLEPGAAFKVLITYSGRPDQIPGGTAGLGDGGWYGTPSGGAIAIGEPFSASAWYPVNEHPSDPAKFQVTATVPQKWSVISNGVPVTTGLPVTPAGTRVFRWAQTKPVTSYATTIYIDTFTTVTDTTVDGKPIISAFSPGPGVAKYKKLAAGTRRILQVLSKHFGPYPFESAGGIYTGQNLSFALETATRPVYADWVDTDTIVHELTHQWFGDDAVVERWSDICLAECFASYGPWLWHQDVDHADLDAQWVSEMSQLAGDPHFWSSPLVDMGPGNEFTSVYSRGPLAVHALRKELGEKAFANLLSGWTTAYGGKAASFDDFLAYVNTTAGRNLTAFIDAWFKGKTVPGAQFRHPGGLGR